ncbi:MAG: drug/metabolite transporter (DMT)-like permease [Ascidiaceihabitans sp.]|jgi:drug/metabolite transporter (DMT)-like permease|tara:strand:- start:2389 stop:3315 length:927 start_codon:yes stop_codon:yes gene_type:complete
MQLGIPKMAAHKMTSDVENAGQANVIGSLWMVAAMAAFAVEDSFFKAAAATVPVGQMLMMFGLGGAIIFACLARFNGEPLYHAAVLSSPMRVRMCFELTGRLFYVLAVALTPLSSATAILQATPIVVVAGAALFFGERVGWMRWAAIAVGLVGVLIVLRPGSDAFSPLSILAVIGMLGLAGRDLASRAAPKSLSTVLLGLYGFLTVIVAGAVFALWQGRAFVWPDPQAAGFVLGAVCIGVFAYTALMKAMRTGEVSVVTPFRYTRLVFGVGLGVVVFGEKLDSATIVGCALIVATGLFIMWRGRRVAG